jgi:hypothetical protein
MKLGNHFNLANNIAVELFQLLCWNPVLLVESTAHVVNFIATKKVRPDLKARDIP